MNTKANSYNTKIIKPRKANKNTKVNKSYHSINIKQILHDHKYAYFDSIRNLYTAPLSNLLTMLVLGFALALPILLYIIVFNINTSLTQWQNNLYQYTIYIDSSYSSSQIDEINAKISSWPEVNSVNVITKSEGLSELKNYMGLNDILENVDHNPLPTVLIVSLKTQNQDIPSLKNLIDKSQSISGLNKVEADIFWLEKLSNLIKLAFNVIYIFSTALAFAVLMVIGNTIRLNIQSQLKEMKIYSLLGATNSFIRRPYLYDGVLYGLFTAVIGLVIAKFLYAKLNVLILELGYDQLFNHQLFFISSSQSMKLLCCSAILGWLGARITLYWQLKSLKRKLVEL